MKRFQSNPRELARRVQAAQQHGETPRPADVAQLALFAEDAPHPAEVVAQSVMPKLLTAISLAGDHGPIDEAAIRAELETLTPEQLLLLQGAAQELRTLANRLRRDKLAHAARINVHSEEV